MNRLFLITGLLAVLLAGCRRHKPQTAMPPLRVGVAEAVTDSVPNRMEFIGYLASNFDAVIQPRVNGYLLTKQFANGMPVKRGQLLFTIDPDQLSTSMLAAEAALQSARAQAVEARNNYDRAVPLARIDAISQSQLDQYTAQWKAAEASVRSAEQSLRNARMNVGYTELRSPIDGIIEHTAAHVGDYVGPGTQFSVLTTVSNIDTLTVDVAIPMSQYLRYAGDRTSIYDNEGLLSDIRLVLADGSRYPLGGIYDYTRKDVSSTTGTLVVVVMFPNPDETLKPGQFARVEASVGPVRPRVVVPQQAVLFTGTIRDNMQWAAPGASDEEIWQALEIAQAAEFVRGKPGMLDAPVETAGRNFSGGQRQRLTIARALVPKPKILILDDSASALDFATDAALRKAIKEETHGMTVFIVSQRAASVQRADHILVLDDGKLVGDAPHAELLRSCEVYKEICLSQLSKEEVAKTL